MTATILTELERLLQEATPGPWFRDDVSHAGYTRICDGKGCKDAHVDCSAVVGLDGFDHMGANDADADLIVAAVNALPRLIAIARAAEAWQDEFAPPVMAWTRAEQRLVAALDALKRAP